VREILILIFIIKKSHKIGTRSYQVQIRFRVSQNERDIQLMELLIKYFGSGIIEINKKHQCYV
jgi:hypothetical protein